MIFTEHQRERLEAAGDWSAVHGAMMDQASNVADAMDDGRVKAAKVAADKVAGLAKRLQVLLTLADRMSK